MALPRLWRSGRVGAVTQPDDAVPDVLAVRQEQESPWHRPRGRHCRQQLRALGRLAPVHGSSPSAAA
eukprot:9019137-Lingulodinium_polyedra.AAC.1